MSQQKNVFEIPQSIQRTVDSIMQGSRDRFGHGLYFMTQGATEGGGDGGSGGSGDGGSGGSGGDGGTGGQSGGQAGGLLDGEAAAGGDGGDGGSGDGGGEGGSGDDQVKQIVDAVTGRFTSEIDRRINGLITTLDRKYGTQGGSGGQQGGNQNGGQSGDGGNGGGGQSAAAGGGVVAADLREGRSEYRDAMSDFKFLGNEEREHALRLAQTVIRDRLEAGDDPVTAGQAAARTVTDEVKGLRTLYETKTIAALKRTGVINEDALPGPGKQQTQGSKIPGQESSFKKGQEAAQRLVGHRMPANADQS